MHDETDPMPNLDKLSDDTIDSLLEMGLLSCKSTVVNPELVETVRRSLNYSGDELSRWLWEDLTAPISSPHQGPLSFRRLTAIDDDTLRALGDTTFLQAFETPQADPDVDRETLECVAEYGELLTAPCFPEPTRFTGAMLHVMALSALSDRCGVSVEFSDLPSTIALLETIGKSGSLSEELREHASRSTQLFKGTMDP